MESDIRLLVDVRETNSSNVLLDCNQIVITVYNDPLTMT